jgi:colicin import membrane protein
MRFPLLAALAALLVAPLSASLAHAEGPAAQPMPRASAPAPATRASKPASARKSASRPRREGKHPAATFPGFRALEGGATRVSVELSEKAQISEMRSEGRIAYRIQGAVVPNRTNRLPLDTSYFKTPVARVQLVASDEDVDLVIELRQPATPKFRVIEGEGGVVLQVDFPPPAEGAAAAEAAPAKSRPSR